MKKGILIYCIAICCSFGMKAQQNVGFNHLTGTANVSIPLYTVGNVPIGLNYSARGIRVRQVAGLVGLGWNLNAGGSIVREVKGLADDTPTNGWLHTTVGTSIENFSESYTSDCTSQAGEYASLDSIYEQKDTQPDVFYINTPFISGRFMFDNDKTIRVQPHQDLSIDYTTSGSKIISFTIIDDFGVIYEFDVMDESSKYVDFEEEDIFFKELQDNHSTANIKLGETWHLSKVSMPNGQYINFNYLLVANVEAVNQKSYRDGVSKNYLYKGSSEGAFGIPYIPTKTNLLSSISTSEGEKVEFIYTMLNDAISNNKLARIDRFTNNILISSYDFHYKNVYPESFQSWSPSDAEREYEKRTFLASVSPRYDTSVYSGYEFDYHGVYDYYNKMPSHKSAAVDIYGFYKKNGDDDVDGVMFYNPAFPDSTQYYTEALISSHADKATEVIQVRELIPNIYYNHALDAQNQWRLNPLPTGHTDKSTEVTITENDRSVDPSGIHFGTLSKLTYPTGGNTRFFYEANEYFDPTADTEYYGPGLRLLRTVVHDGVSNENNIITNYTYDDGQTSPATSGVIVERPKYAFGTPFKSELDSLNPALTFAEITGPNLERAQFLSIRTNFDMSSGNASVLYQRVGVARAESGKSIYNFDIPATIDDASANNGQWEPTEIKVAGNNTSSTDCYVLGRFSTGANVYPFADNPNYNFQRGLISSIKAYDESGDPVSETAYEYIQTVPTGADTAIYGLVIDKIPSYKVSNGIPADPSNQEYVFAYGKYRLFDNIRSVRSKVTQTLYNPSDTTRKMVTTTEYTYNGTDKRLSETSITNSDGTIAKSYTQYVADYSAGYSMLDSLQSKHQNGLVVERYGTVKAPGDSAKLVSATVTIFDDFGKNVIHPHEQYALNKTATIELSNFTPSTVSGSSFNKDSQYELTQTITDYDLIEKVASTEGRSKIKSGVHWGYTHNTPLAEISNAGAKHFLYSGFEEDTRHDFEPKASATSTSVGTPVRTGSQSLSLVSGTANAIIGEIVKDAKTDNLVVSFWLSASASGVITCDFNSADGTTTHTTETVNYQSTTGWEYHETILDIASLSDTTYQVSISSNGNAHLDDVLTYPEEANVSYRSLGDKGELLSESVAGKTTTYYEYDELLRNTIVRDDDQNILNKTEYTDIEISPPDSYEFIYKGLNTVEEAVFEFVDPDITGLTGSTIDFGDGNSASMSGKHSITHAYDSTLTYAVTYSYTEGGLSKLTRQTILVEPLASVDICAAGPQVLDKCEPYALSIFQDGCISSTGYDVASTVFRLDDIVNCTDCDGETITYDWQVRHNGTGPFTTVGTNDMVTLMYNNSFEVKCILTVGTTNPITIFSDTKSVSVINSTGSCPDFPLN